MKGFTLTELAIVIVIAAILAALVIPQFNIRDIDAAWYYEQVRSGVRYAQRTAVAQRRPVFVVVEAGPRLALCYADPCGTRVTDLATGSPVLLDAPAGVALTISVSPLSFNGLGQPSSAATINVGGQTIIVNAETGYVQ
ncbi:MAG TPA: GspH/FimT family pseudopilin [Burkholderiales bacterium]|nr:GspH/FimT family pseudopilin [Burkholderiales bacterium]